MAFVTGKHLSRRTVIRGMGATMALPFLDAMVPAGRRTRSVMAEPGETRLICMEEAMGCAGANEWGVEQHLFGPAKLGKDFEIGPQSMLKPLEDYRDHLTIISNTDLRMAESY